MNMTANDNGDDNISPLKKTTSQIEEQLVTDADDNTNETYMPLSSTIVPKTKEGEAVCSSKFRKRLNNRCSR